MTDAKLQELKSTAKNILTYNRLQLLNKHPFIGNIAMNLELIPTRDARCNTAMTDGNSIYFDIDFLSKLTQDEIQFVLGHEIWHVIMCHFLRMDKRVHSFFNIATDMEVNQILEADGFIPPVDALFPNKNHSKKCEFNFPDNLSAEEYYELIKKFYEEGRQNKESIEKAANPQSNTEEKKKSTPNCGGHFDKHFDAEENQEEALKEAMNKGASDKYGTKEADSDFNPAQMNTESKVREATEKVREMVVSAAQTYEKTRGELPGYIKKYVNKLLDAKLPWKELLAKFITTGIASKTNWNSPNRRFAYSGTYLPSHKGETMRIAIGIDTSGSCENECEKFLSEIVGITKNFDSYELHLIQCDTDVRKYDLYDENNLLDPENSVEFKGFGGTVLKPIFSYIDLNDIEVDAVIIFTDGYCEEFTKEVNYNLPLMWVICGDNECKNIQIGEKIYMK